MGARARLTSAFAWLKARPHLLAGLQIAAVVALLAFLVYEFSDAVRDAWPRLRHADLKLVALALVLLAIYYLLFVIGWQSILRAYGIRMRYRAVLGAEMLSMLAKYIPGGVWSGWIGLQAAVGAPTRLGWPRRFRRAATATFRPTRGLARSARLPRGFAGAPPAS